MPLTACCIPSNGNDWHPEFYGTLLDRHTCTRALRRRPLLFGACHKREMRWPVGQASGIAWKDHTCSSRLAKER